VLAVMPLYTAPQPQREWVEVECPLCGEMAVAHTHPVLNKRKWVGLTQEDIDIAFDDTQEGGGFNEFARAIEQILRSKNT
jgi:hypothetical protein